VNDAPSFVDAVPLSVNADTAPIAGLPTYKTPLATST
jgi:hypothetical protein